MIAAILLVIGAPSFKSFILRQQVKTASYELNCMRSEVIKRNDLMLLTTAATG